METLQKTIIEYYTNARRFRSTHERLKYWNRALGAINLFVELFPEQANEAKKLWKKWDDKFLLLVW